MPPPPSKIFISNSVFLTLNLEVFQEGIYNIFLVVNIRQSHIKLMFLRFKCSLICIMYGSSYYQSTGDMVYIEQLLYTRLSVKLKMMYWYYKDRIRYEEFMVTSCLGLLFESWTASSLIHSTEVRPVSVCPFFGLPQILILNTYKIHSTWMA